MITLFVDDLTFSNEQPITQSFKDYVVNKLNSERLSINTKKNIKDRFVTYKTITSDC